MKPTRNSRLLFIAAVCAVLFVACFVAFVKANAEPIIIKLGRGVSMEPMISVGDKMECVPVQPGERLKGKVIIFKGWSKDGRTVAHLCTSETPTHVYTTGINNRKSDGWSPKTEVYFVVTGIIKKP